MDNIILLILGILISVVGIVNMTGNISTIHSYNRRNVTEEDAPKYGKAVGIGTLIIGAACIADFILLLFNLENIMAILTIAAFAVGLILILYAQFKYNKGIF